MNLSAGGIHGTGYGFQINGPCAFIINSNKRLFVKPHTLKGVHMPQEIKFRYTIYQIAYAEEHLHRSGLKKKARLNS